MKTPPRLVARTLTVTFVMVAVILAVVFVVITLDVRDRVHAAETDKLRVSENVFSALRTAPRARPPRPFAELERFCGTQFDPGCVEALLAAMPSTEDIEEPALAQLLGRQLV